MTPETQSRIIALYEQALERIRDCHYGQYGSCTNTAEQALVQAKLLSAKQEVQPCPGNQSRS
jgi:hypothetical protein